MHYLVRHGVMRFLGDFEANADIVYRRNQDVVLETERGLEIGEFLSETTQQALDYIEEPTNVPTVRVMGDADLDQLLEAQAREDAAYHRGNDFIHTRQL